MEFSRHPVAGLNITSLNAVQLPNTPPSPLLESLTNGIQHRLSLAGKFVDESVFKLRAEIFGTAEASVIASFLHANPSVPSRQLVAGYRLHTIVSSLGVEAVNLRLDTLFPRKEHKNEGGGSTLDLGFAEIPVLDSRKLYCEQSITLPDDWRDILEQKISRILVPSKTQVLLARCEQIVSCIARASCATTAVADLTGLPSVASTPYSRVVSRIAQNLEGIAELSGLTAEMPLARNVHADNSSDKLNLKNFTVTQISDRLLNGSALASNELLAAVIVATRMVHFGNMYDFKDNFSEFDFLFLPDNQDGTSVVCSGNSLNTKQRSLATRDLTLFNIEQYRAMVIEAAAGSSTPVVVENHNSQLQRTAKIP